MTPAAPGSLTALAGPATLAGLAALLVVGCWRTGEPTPSDALVTWAAYPETVRTGAVFSLEFAGPISADACGRLDTAIARLADSTLELSARRSVFEDAMCADEPVSFYEAQPFSVDRPGRYAVRTAQGTDLGTLVAGDSVAFSSMGTRGLGTVRGVAGCLLFGPGWASNQRPFALRDPPRELVAAAGTGRVVYVRGRLRGFTLCGWYGSRPSIQVDTAWVTERTTADYY